MYQSSRFSNIRRPAPHSSYRLKENIELFAYEKKQHLKGFISHPNKTLTELQHLKKVF